MYDEIDNKIKIIVAKELGCHPRDLSDNAGWNKTFGWDSLAHIGIITALEKEFSIVIPDEQIVILSNVNLIKRYIIKKEEL